MTNAEKFKEVFGFEYKGNQRKDCITLYDWWQSEYKEPIDLDHNCTKCEKYDKENDNCPTFCRVIAETAREVKDNLITDNNAKWQKAIKSIKKEIEKNYVNPYAIIKLIDKHTKELMQI